MRGLMITAGTLIFAAGVVAGGRLEPLVGAQGLTVVMDCGASSKVLLLVHPDTAAARQSVLAVIEAYRKTFEQQSVLWENARVCGAA